MPGASAYFLGGAVVYTINSRKGLLDIGDLPQGMRASTEPYALLLARTVRQRLGASWAPRRDRCERARPATAMAMRPGIAASPWSARASAP